MASNPLAPTSTQGFGSIQGLTVPTFRGDPALIVASSSVQQALAFAEAEALRRQRELLIDYGDPALTEKVLGASKTTAVNQPKNTKQTVGVSWYGNASPGHQNIKVQGPKSNQLLTQTPATPAQSAAFNADVEATRNNPFSVLKKLSHEMDLSQKDMREKVNEANLWYSGEHQRQEGLLGRAYSEAQYDASRSVQQQLAEIEATLQAARLSAQDQLAQSILNAQRERAQREMAMYG